MSDSVTLLNSIRESLGGDYAERIPEAVRNNITAVGNTILSYQPHTNAFMTQLLNRISATVIKHVDEIDDIYAVFNSKDIKFGDTIQKIFIDVVESKPFVGSATLNPASMLAVEKGTIHVEYTSIDRKLFYKVTLSIEELREAFLTVDKLDEFIEAQVGSMTRSYALDRYIMLSNLLRKHASLILSGYFAQLEDASHNPIPVNVNAVIVPESMGKYNLTSGEMEWTTTGAKEFLKLIRKISRSLKFPHKLSYYNVEDADKAPVSSDTDNVDTDSLGTIKCVRTPISRQVVALEVPTMAEIDVEALAVLFHMDKAEIESRMIELEEGVLSYPISQDETDDENSLYLLGFICDKDAVERGKSFEASEAFKNPEHLYVNYWQHHWGYMAVSKFADFVPIVAQTYTPSEGE